MRSALSPLEWPRSSLNCLKLVEVAEEQRERRLLLAGAIDLLGEPLVQVAVVVKTGEPVGDGLDLSAVPASGGGLQHGGQRLPAPAAQAAQTSRRERRQVGSDDRDGFAVAIAHPPSVDPHAELVGEQGVHVDALAGQHAVQVVVGEDLLAQMGLLPRLLLLAVTDDDVAIADPGVSGDEAHRRMCVTCLA